MLVPFDLPLAIIAQWVKRYFWLELLLTNYDTSWVAIATFYFNRIWHKLLKTVGGAKVCTCFITHRKCNEYEIAEISYLRQHNVTLVNKVALIKTEALFPVKIRYHFSKGQISLEMLTIQKKLSELLQDAN